MGTPDFALTALRTINEHPSHDVVCVYSQPPRPKGRGHKVQLSPVHAYAEAQDILVRTPTSLKSADEQDAFRALDLDVAVVAAYGLILPKAVLEAPRFGCINIHASLLPRWRGAAPIQHAIMAGDRETGITLMQMDEGLDTGPEIVKKSIPITEDTTTPGLHDDLAALGGEMIVEALDNLLKDGDLPASPQVGESTYASMLSRDSGRINWDVSALEIARQVRAMTPWPGAWCMAGSDRLKVLSVDKVSENGSDATPSGTILNKTGDVQCGAGTVLRLSKIQPAGKKPMDFGAALNGNLLKVVDRLQ